MIFKVEKKRMGIMMGEKEDSGVKKRERRMIGMMGWGDRR